VTGGATPRLPLAGPLALLLPGGRQTLLLRSALLPPARAREAFDTWQGTGTASTWELAEREGGRLLGPLIASKLAGNGGAGEARAWTYLRAALLRETLRARRLREISAAALRALRDAGIPVVLLRGVAAAETVYAEPALRHCNDLDLLVPRPDLDAAGPALAGVGFRSGLPASMSHTTRGFVHESGMPVALHTDLFRTPHYNRGLERVLARIRQADVLDTSVRLLAPADQLLHLLLHAATDASRTRLLWASDAWLTIHAESRLDWDAFLAEATGRGAALPLAIMLRYLADDLAAPVPPPVLDALQARAAQATRVDKEVALWGVAVGPGTTTRRMLAQPASVSERAFVLRWRLLPAPDALVAAGQVSARSARRLPLDRPDRPAVAGGHGGTWPPRRLARPDHPKSRPSA
jgi:hypothetical protein